MFRVVTNSSEYRLSPYFEAYESSRRGLLLKMRRINTEFGRQSLIFRCPVVCNGLNSNSRNLVNKDQFRNALKKFGRLCQIFLIQTFFFYMIVFFTSFKCCGYNLLICTYSFNFFIQRSLICYLLL